MTKATVSRCILAYFYKLVYLKIISQIEFLNSHDVVSFIMSTLQKMCTFFRVHVKEEKIRRFLISMF